MIDFITTPRKTDPKDGEPLRILLSPAKKMRVDRDFMPCESLPFFLPQAATLLQQLRGMDYARLKTLWNCNDAIASFQYQRLETMDLEHNLTPAILSYVGIQYQYMAPQVFETGQFAYIQEHLRILSGFYGLLCPFDGVTPYRLEMQAKLSVGNAKDLYAFWGDKLAKHLCTQTDVLLNLASKEYSKAVLPHLPRSVRVLTCTFGEEKGGKIVEKGTLCKMARGEMVRWLAETNLTDPKNLRFFNRLGYSFSQRHSSGDHYVYIKGGTNHAPTRLQSS